MDEITKQVFARMDAIAAKLGVAAGVLWSLYLRQAKLYAIENLIAFLAMAILAFFMRKYAAYTYRTGMALDSPNRRGNHILGTVFLGIPCFIFMLAALWFLQETLTAAFNPGYWAFQQIVEQLRGQ